MDDDGGLVYLLGGGLRELVLWIPRTEHATILPRQSDHAFRPQSCLLFQYYYFVFGVATSHRHRYLNIFRIFSGPLGEIALSLLRSFKIVACPALMIPEVSYIGNSATF